MLWHGRLVHWSGFRGRGGRVGDSHDLEDADILPRMQVERLWPVIVNGYPQFGTTGKHGYPSHECRQSVSWAKIDVLWATGCGSGLGGRFRQVSPLSGAAERGYRCEE